MATKVSPADRITNLVFFLVSSPGGLTREQIFQVIRGYSEESVGRISPEALERMFERDKEDLRSLGVPITAIEDPGDPGNNQNLRYIIDRAEFSIPDDVQFSEEEMHFLALAAESWQGTSLSSEMSTARLKLLALQPDLDEEPSQELEPMIRSTKNHDECMRAIDGQRLISFNYHAAGYETPAFRTVEPLALVSFRNRWYLSAWNIEISETRTYLLDRIIGSVQIGKKISSPHGREEAGEICLTDLAKRWENQVATLLIRENSEAYQRLSRQGSVIQSDPQQKPGFAKLNLHYSDDELLLDTLLPYGPDVVVLEPAPLREKIILWLKNLQNQNELTADEPTENR